MNEELLQIKGFLSDLKDAVGQDCTVSITLNEDGLVGLVSFHNNDALSEEVDPIHIQFEDSDFESKESLLEDVQSFCPQYIQRQISD